MTKASAFLGRRSKSLIVFDRFGTNVGHVCVQNDWSIFPFDLCSDSLGKLGFYIESYQRGAYFVFRRRLGLFPWGTRLRRRRRCGQVLWLQDYVRYRLTAWSPVDGDVPDHAVHKGIACFRTASMQIPPGDRHV